MIPEPADRSAAERATSRTVTRRPGAAAAPGLAWYQYIRSSLGMEMCRTLPLPRSPSNLPVTTLVFAGLFRRIRHAWRLPDASKHSPAARTAFRA
jgi:hypothetical protein